MPSRLDPAVPIAAKLIKDFASFDAHLLVEDEDPAVKASALGPNPKIRNMSRAYREAKGDIVWILDCNVWIAPGTAGRLVDTLCGLSRHETHRPRPHKLVHQLPLAVDVTGDEVTKTGANGSPVQVASSSTKAVQTLKPENIPQNGLVRRILQGGGSRLDELFLASSHAKFYTAINTVLIAPCIVGKSNMFRMSHLNHLTQGTASNHRGGIDYFSHNICEDHLVGDLLWKNSVPEEQDGSHKLGKHALVFGDLAIQPVAGMSVREYIARRVRWLRVRKFTVTLATLVEPGTESFLCSIIAAYAVTSIPSLARLLQITPTWSSFIMLWILNVSVWALVDWTLFRILHSMGSVVKDVYTPFFARCNHPSNVIRRGFLEWVFAWLGREALALPIWLVAVFGGVTVTWRGQKFRVGMDMRVYSLDQTRNFSGGSLMNGGPASKAHGE